MCFPKFTAFVIVVTFLPCSQSAVGASYVHYVCQSYENFTSNDPFETSLNELLSYLYYETPSTGFSMAFKGEGQNRAYGHALCHGGTPPSNCSSCVAQAINDLGSLCWHINGATIWYRECHLKYLNEDFLGQIDNAYWYSHLNGPENVTEPTLLHLKRVNLFSSLALKASVDPKMYAIGSLDIEVSLRLYGTAECKRDLSRIACRKCLLDSIAVFPNCCYAKKQVWVFSGSCDIRHVVLLTGGFFTCLEN